MPSDSARRQITYEAARLLYAREESEYYRAKIRAARIVLGGSISVGELLGNRSARYQLPRNKEIREQILEFARSDRREIDPNELGALPELSPAHEALSDDDRYLAFALLLEPLATVMLDRDTHPEGDALYHSLQVFELMRKAHPYDEELLLAALLHDVGKAIDPRDHVAAGLEALEGLITPRTAWFIEHHAAGLAWGDSNLGLRVRRRLQSSDDFDELMSLAQCDRAGRQIAAPAPDVQDALQYLRDLATMCDGQ